MLQSHTEYLRGLRGDWDGPSCSAGAQESFSRSVMPNSTAPCSAPRGSWVLSWTYAPSCNYANLHDINAGILAHHHLHPADELSLHTAALHWFHAAC